ncbi:MAG TPA: zinc-ribbon domain-containing protein [Candidatus Lokiarchaeia archaeon]|nr:zinc-ribbon domain-containing protein [Candidatus Lokiarchaeia archaeon]
MENPPPNPQFCSTCGNPLVQDAKFCMRCGRPVQAFVPAGFPPSTAPARKVKKSFALALIAIIASLLALVTPLISISEGIPGTAYAITMTFDIWGYLSVGSYAIYLPSLGQNGSLAAFAALPMAGVVVIIGMLILGIGLVPREQIQKNSRAINLVGGVLILLGPILFFVLLGSAFTSLLAGTGVSFSFADLPIEFVGFGTYAGVIGGLLGIVAGIASRNVEKRPPFMYPQSQVQ